MLYFIISHYNNKIINKSTLLPYFITISYIYSSNLYKYFNIFIVLLPYPLNIFNSLINC